MSSVVSRQPSAGIKKTFSLGLLFSLILLACLVLRASPVSAQLEIADSYDLTDQEAVGGDILSLTTEGLKRSNSDYDNKIFGAINSDPLAAYKRVDGTGTLVSRSGVVTVNVTTANGAIKTGDFITSSTIAGKGQKALAFLEVEISAYSIRIATGIWPELIFRGSVFSNWAKSI
jgi:hypothetical protein